MSALIVYDTVSSVFEMLWDIALAYFVVRLGFIYAVLAGASSAATTYLLTWAMQYHVLLPPGTIQPSALSVAIPAAQLAASAVCARFVVSRHEIPRDWRLRAAVGAVGAAVIGVEELFLGMVTQGLAGYEMALGGKAFMLCVAALPMALMLFEPRKGGPYAREDSWLPVENEKTGY